MNVPSISPQTHLPDSSTALSFRPLTRFFALVNTIRGFWASTNQPRVQECVNHKGKFWRVYDPETRKSAICFSEDEVRIWLEQRYYA